MILADDVEVEYVLRQDHAGMKAGTRVVARRSCGFLIFSKGFERISLMGSRYFLQDIEEPTREELDAQEAAVIRQSYDAVVFLAS